MNFKSLLFIPCNEKMLRRLGTLGADGYILDLEDSIGSEDKEIALALLVDKLNSTPEDLRSSLFVRINKDRYQKEVDILNTFSGIGFMLPKFETVDDYMTKEGDWSEHPVIALIESPLGLVNIQQIAACAWVDALAFGAEDYTANIGMKNEIKYLQYPKSSIVTFASAFGKKSYDTPSFSLNDPVKFENEVSNAVDMGFDGKLAIHPKQIDLINNLFNAYDLDTLTNIVHTYEAMNEAVCVIDGVPYEKMHINRFKRILKENRRIL